MDRSAAVRVRVGLVGGLLWAFAAGGANAQIPHPRDVFGFDPGEDYKLADYPQLLDYYRQLDAASERFRLVEIGRTTQDRPMVLGFVSSEANLRDLDRWKGISARLARARGVPEEEARRLASEGRAIVWIDSGLHSTEVAHSQHAPLLAHHMVTDESPETRRVRDDVILLLMPVMNPDGHEIVVSWYRSQLGTPFETTGPPVLYHQYVGHDNNRDWYMLLQKETQALARAAYHEWFPQVLLNHHQTAPFPARIHIGPFAEPLNPAIPPLVVRGVNLFGTYMAQRFEREKMTGVLSRRRFDMWRADGTRYAPYYRNLIGLHTEVGHASATPRYHDPASLPRAFPGEEGVEFLSAVEPSVFYPNPWPGGWARLGDAVRYHFVASLAVLDLASKLREELLYNVYWLGREAIEAGERGGPFAFVVPGDQWDPGEAVEMVNALRRGGVDVHQATAPFTAGGQRYEAGAYLILAGQAFRPLLKVLLERQQYPERRQYPGGPVDPPRDLAGWTMPVQMGVRVDPIEEPFQASLSPVDEARPAPARIVGSGRWGFAFGRRHNASALAVNRLLAGGDAVSWASGGVRAGGVELEPGAVVVQGAGGDTRARVERVATELGIEVVALDSEPDGVTLHRLRAPRVGLYKSWVPSMDEGWTRWLLEQYEFDVDTLVDAQVRSGALNGYDVIILPDQRAASMLNGHLPGSMPEEYVGGLGAEGAAALKRFVERGGTLVALDGASDFAIQQFGLPVRNVVDDLPAARFFIPGSLLRLEVDPGHPLASGMPPEAAAFFVRSRAFEVIRPATEGDRSAGPQPVDVVARYADSDLLLSGLEVGGEHVAGRPAVLLAGVGEGRVVLIGFRSQFRAQSRGTFKFLFNAIQGSTGDALPRPGVLAADAGGD